MPEPVPVLGMLHCAASIQLTQVGSGSGYQQPPCLPDSFAFLLVQATTLWLWGSGRRFRPLPSPEHTLQTGCYVYQTLLGAQQTRCRCRWRRWRCWNEWLAGTWDGLMCSRWGLVLLVLHGICVPVSLLPACF